MDIYTQKSKWKIWLAITGLIILAISMYYTTYLASKLAEGERNKAELFIQANEAVFKASDDQDLSYYLEVIKRNDDIPIILVNDRDKVEIGHNFGEERNGDIAFLEKEVELLKSQGNEPTHERNANFEV